MSADPAPVGLLIVRAWVEGTSEDGLRAVVTRTLDVAGGQETVTHAGTVQDVLAVTETWLRALTSARPGTEDGSPGEPAP